MPRLTREQKQRVLSELKFMVDSGKLKPETQTRQDDATPVQKVLKYPDYFDIGLQYLPGDERHGKTLPMSYGHLRKTREPSDGMALDCYVHNQVVIGAVNPWELPLFALAQLTPEGEFDEIKLFLGWQYPEDVKTYYCLVMPPEMCGDIEEWSVDDLEEYRVDAGDHADAFPLVKSKLKLGDYTIAITHDPMEMRFEHGLPMRSHYGHLEGTYGMAEDGKAFDFYVAPGFTPVQDRLPTLHRIIQTTLEGEPDESKFMLGYPDIRTARDEFIYHAGRDRFGAIQPFDWDDFSAIQTGEEDYDEDDDELEPESEYEEVDTDDYDDEEELFDGLNLDELLDPKD